MCFIIRRKAVDHHNWGASHASGLYTFPSFSHFSPLIGDKMDEWIEGCDGVIVGEGRG